jgi:hypothetical protein
MVYCNKCGKKNEDNARFCIKCGSSLKLEKNKKEEELTEKVKKIGEKVGKKIEKTAEEVGKQVEKSVEQAGKGFGSWYYRTFGVFGPLVSSFLGLIILRFIIEILSLSSTEVTVLGVISEFLYDYILLFFILMLLSSYNSYFYRHYKRQWLAAKILLILDTSLDIPILASIASFIETYLVLISIFVLLIGYIYQMFTVSMTKERNR